MRAVVECERDPAPVRQGRRNADQPARCGARPAPPPARTRPQARRVRAGQRASPAASTNDAAERRSSKPEVLRPAACDGALDRGSQLRPRLRDLGKPEAQERLVVLPDVTAPPAVRHDRTPAEQRLEDREAAGRVHEDVGGGEPVRHRLGEPFDLDARLAVEAGCEQRRAARRSVRSGRPRSSRERAAPPRSRPATSPTPQPPPETTTSVAPGGTAAPTRASARDRGA